MNSSKRGRTIALFTGAGVIGIAVLGFVYWKDIVVQYHLYVLRNDPDYLVELIEEPEGTPEHKALSVFVGSPQGNSRLCELYASKLLQFLASRPASISRSWSLASYGTVILGYRDNNTGRPWRVWYRGGGGGGDGIYSNAQLLGIYRLFEKVGVSKFNEFRLPDYATLRLTVLPGDKAFLVSGMTRDGGSFPDKTEVWLLIRKDPAVGEVDSVSPCVLPLLFRALQDKDAKVRSLANRTLVGAGHDLENPAPRLVYMLGDPLVNCHHRDHPWLRHDPVAQALGEIGPAVLPALVEELQEQTGRSRSRYTLSQAFRAVGLPAVPALTEAAKSSNSLALKVVRQARDGIRKDYRGKTSELIKALEDERREIRLLAVRLILGDKTTTRKALPQLVRLLKDESAGIRYCAIRSLGTLGLEASEAIPGLKELLNDDAESVRKAASKALEAVRDQK